jgi:hypothetical protein
MSYARSDIGMPFEETPQSSISMAAPHWRGGLCEGGSRLCVIGGASRHFLSPPTTSTRIGTGNVAMRAADCVGSQFPLVRASFVDH